MKLIWLTDIHLNFVEPSKRFEFYEAIIKKKGDGILITGDIAEAPSTVTLLKEMVGAIQKPIYFVLGNHDYYRGWIEDVKNEMTNLTKEEKLLYWLPAAGPQTVKKEVIVLGQDAWADGRNGDFENSRIKVNDDRMIMDFFEMKMLGKYRLLEKMQELADQNAEKLHDDLINIIDQPHPKTIIILLHVPPFKEACYYEGKRSPEDHLPFFSSQVMGETITTIVRANPTIQFLVLCGHTHEAAQYQALQNLLVKVGKAEYGFPQVQEVIAING